MSQKWQTSDGAYAYSASVNTRPERSHPDYATHPARRGGSGNAPVQEAYGQAYQQAPQGSSSYPSQQSYGQSDQRPYAGLPYSPPIKQAGTSRPDEDLYTRPINPEHDLDDKWNKVPKYSLYSVPTAYGEQELTRRTIEGQSAAQEYAKERERQRL